jgi:1-aminocyclopropane-1-carboxylate deaminase
MVSALTPGNITIDNISYLFGGMTEVSVLRLDKLHPLISGNKWFKLRYYLEEAKTLQKKNIVTFGGAWSNHLLATAAASRLYGFTSTGIIRGQEFPGLSSTLQQVKELGMQLIFISREEYKKKYVPPELLSAGHYMIPEGGYGEKGADGAATILAHCPGPFTHYCCAIGTGTMMAGLINAVGHEQQVIGISVMKNNSDIPACITSLVKDDKKNWELVEGYHFGGYAKHQLPLTEFMNDFYRKTNTPSDFVYTGKLFYAVSYLIREKFFPDGSKILVIHSGGLQGNTSLRKGTLIF